VPGLQGSRLFQPKRAAAVAHVVVVGSYIQDLTFRTETFPRPGETRIGTFVTGPGGKGSNQAVAAHRQGVDTLFLGAVGDDIFGSGYRDFCTAEGLRAELQTVTGVSTGAAGIVVDAQAQNLITVSLGASGELSPRHIERFASEFSTAKVVVCQLECNLAAVRRAFELGRTSGALNILNPAPINPALTADLLSLVDILVPNESEFAFLLKHLTGEPPEDGFWLAPDSHLQSLCERLAVPTVVLTLGDKGCAVARNRVRGGGPWVETPAFQRIPAAIVKPVDTTGAGDAFTGGLAAGLTRFGGDLTAAVRFATVVAGLSTQRFGTAPAMPSMADVQTYMRKEAAARGVS
jgi:ribokinase